MSIQTDAHLNRVHDIRLQLDDDGLEELHTDLHRLWVYTQTNSDSSTALNEVTVNLIAAVERLQKDAMKFQPTFTALHKHDVENDHAPRS